MARGTSTRQHLGNNGDVLMVRDADASGITLENAKGTVATVPWAKLRRARSQQHFKLAGAGRRKGPPTGTLQG
jgi:hypothetical protein